MAQLTFDAVRENRFYVFTHPQILPSVRARFDAVLSGAAPADPYACAPFLEATDSDSHRNRVSCTWLHVIALPKFARWQNACRLPGIVAMIPSPVAGLPPLSCLPQLGVAAAQTRLRPVSRAGRR